MRKNTERSEGLTVVKQFNSKKNEVYLIKHGAEQYIQKRFNNQELFETEKNFYLMMIKEEFKTPRLLDYNLSKRELLIEYIACSTLLDRLEAYEFKQSYDNAYSLLTQLIDYLYRFSQLQYIKSNNLCYYDINFRNFLVDNHQIIGIDFEDIRSGTFVQDAAKTIAMHLFYSPVCSDFKLEVSERLKAYLAARYQISAAEINRLIEEEIKSIKMRRDSRN